MRRRAWLRLALGLSFGGLGRAWAQDGRPSRTARIGRLSPLSAEGDRLSLDAFRKGMAELGWIEGKTFTIDARFADGRLDRLPELAAQLVQQQADLILAGSHPGVAAAKKATSTLPILMVTTSDPVEGGLVTSLARPGGNVTGLTALGQFLNAKRLELLKEAIPGIGRVGVLGHGGSTYTSAFQKERVATGRALSLELPLAEVSGVAELDRAFEVLVSERARALMVLNDPFLLTHRRRIVEMAAKNRLPAVYGESAFVDVGGLMFYGARLVDMYREAAVYADKILKGAKPADLPVEQPTKLALIINQRTAKAQGLSVPASVLLRADRVIE